MSLHKSLKLKDVLARSRNVLTRAERLAILKERGLWKDGDSVLGLPKLRTQVKFKRRKKKEAPPEEAKEGEAEAPEESAEKKKPV
ncbi:MAG: small basic protein [Planctomycetota bacterium]|jgi:small basic protein (TIGR04137 family)